MSYPEPLDVGPAAGGHLRVSDADRTAARAELTKARDDGRLTPDEFVDRDAAAQTAKTRDDLIPLIRDLADPVALGLAEAPAAQPWQQLAVPASDTAVATRTDESKPDVAIGILSTASRRGHWTAAPKTVAVSVLGETVLDFTTAAWPAPELEIVVASVMGEIKLIVGPDVEVQTRGVGIEDKRRQLAPRSGRRLVVHGAGILSDVKIVDAKR